MSEKAIWLEHEFTVYDPEITDWHEVGGLYIFAGLVSDEKGKSLWRPFYIGQTQNFAERLPTHEDWPEAELLGATHIHAMGLQNARIRAKREKDLVQHYQPRLNVQLKN